MAELLVNLAIYIYITILMDLSLPVNDSSSDSNNISPNRDQVQNSPILVFNSAANCTAVEFKGARFQREIKSENNLNFFQFTPPGLCVPVLFPHVAIILPEDTVNQLEHSGTEPSMYFTLTEMLGA